MRAVRLPGGRAARFLLLRKSLVAPTHCPIVVVVGTENRWNAV
jgi:hypothetical protein